MILNFPQQGPVSWLFFSACISLAFFAPQFPFLGWFSGAALCFFIPLGPVRWIVKRVELHFQSGGVLGRRLDYEWADFHRKVYGRLLWIEGSLFAVGCILILFGIMDALS